MEVEKGDADGGSDSPGSPTLSPLSPDMSPAVLVTAAPSIIDGLPPLILPPPVAIAAAGVQRDTIGDGNQSVCISWSVAACR